MKVQPIDVTYILAGHGWSSCHFFVGHKIYSYEPTHVFNNPLEELIFGLIGLMRGEKSSTVKWFDEPGAYELTFNIDKVRNDYVEVVIDSYAEDNTVTNSKKLASVGFKCYLRDFVICFWHQLQKLSKQLERKKFAEIRRQDFPVQAFKKFNKAYAKKYS